MTLTSKQTLILLLIITGVLFAAVMGTYNTLTNPYPGHNDFMSRWEGARSYWVEGLNPYGEEASLNIQERIYGRAVTETEDPGFFAYPFYTNFLLLPVVFTSYAWASAIWMVLLEAGLIVALFLLFDHFQWRPAPLLLGALFLWVLMSYFPARGLLLGQPGLLVYLLEVVAIWALAKDQDRLAGAVLALSTLKPQMGYLLVPFLLLWGLREKRWQFVGAFAAVFGGLMLLSFLLLPTWLHDWLSQISLYTSYTALGSPVWIVANGLWLGVDPQTGLWGVSGGFGDFLNILGSAAFYSFMLWAWYAVLIQRKSERLMWTIIMTLAVTHLVAPRTATPHFVVFIIPMIFYFRWLTTQYRRRGSLYAGLILLVLFVGQWAHFLLTVEGEFEHPTIYLPTPFFIFFLLWFTRHWWWRDKHDRFVEKIKREEAAA